MGPRAPRAQATSKRMMAELGLKEEDPDDVIFDEKDAPPTQMDCVG